MSRPLLASAGYRVIVPYLRGYGTTRFLSSETFRNGQPSAVAVDLIALMDALKIEKAILAGFDWGARTANIVAALWPERCKAMVSVSGYLIGSQEAGKMPLPPKAELEWWYQFYFATERGRAGYDKYRHDFAKLIWQLASPKWNFDDATFDRSAASFDNPDHVAIVIHNYRWRLALAEGEPKYDDLDKRLAAGPVITVPTITLEGDANGAPHARSQRLCQEILGQVFAPDHHGRHRSQSAAGSAAGLCPGGGRRRRLLIERGDALGGIHHETQASSCLQRCSPAPSESPIDTSAAETNAVPRAMPVAINLPVEGSLPSLAGATAWLNSPPLTAAGLRGKVVLVDVWTYTCINWLRTLPYVRAWAEKYKDQGLVVIGVHSPEFAFEHNIDNVRRAAKDMRVDYPIAIDNDFAIWHAFNNQYWPALYLVDAQGRIRHHQFGEGEYERSERVIQQLLAEAGASGVSQRSGVGRAARRGSRRRLGQPEVTGELCRL